MFKIRARVVAPQGNAALAVRWLIESDGDEIPIGGPNFNSIPVDLVPPKLRCPNSEFWVVFQARWDIGDILPID